VDSQQFGGAMTENLAELFDETPLAKRSADNRYAESPATKSASGSALKGLSRATMQGVAMDSVKGAKDDARGGRPVKGA